MIKFLIVTIIFTLFVFFPPGGKADSYMRVGTVIEQINQQLDFGTRKLPVVTKKTT